MRDLSIILIGVSVFALSISWIFQLGKLDARLDKIEAAIAWERVP